MITIENVTSFNIFSKSIPQIEIQVKYLYNAKFIISNNNNV